MNMALFGFGKKKQPDPAPKQEHETIVLWTKEFIQANSFRGFKRIRLTTYGEKGVADTLDYFEKQGNKFKDRVIRPEHIRVKGVFEDGDLLVVNVYVDNMRIGCVYAPKDYYKMLTENEYNKAHIRIDGDAVYLFINC